MSSSPTNSEIIDHQMLNKSLVNYYNGRTETPRTEVFHCVLKCFSGSRIVGDNLVTDKDLILSRI